MRDQGRGNWRTKNGAMDTRAKRGYDQQKLQRGHESEIYNVSIGLSIMS